MRALLVAVGVIVAALFLEVDIRIRSPENIQKLIQTIIHTTTSSFTHTQQQITTYKLFKTGEYQNPVLCNDTIGEVPFDELKHLFASTLYPTNLYNNTVITLYTPTGDVINNRVELINSENNTVYVILGTDMFIHPGNYVGQKVVVGGKVLETLSLLPRVFMVHNFLSHEECDAIVAEAAAKEEPSTVFEGNGKSSSSSRTSTTSYVIYTHEFVDRAFNVTRLPKDSGYLYPDHMLQVIHYRKHQYFHPHHDAFNSDVHHEPWFKNGLRNRFLTLFIYLSGVEDGGETAFLRYADLSKFKSDQYDIHTKNPCDLYAVLKVTPQKGSAVLFYDLEIGKHLEGKIEWESLHTGCGVKTGEKWACNVWMYNTPFHDATADSVMDQWGLLGYPDIIKPKTNTVSTPATPTPPAYDTDDKPTLDAVATPALEEVSSGVTFPNSASPPATLDTATAVPEAA